MLFFNLLNVKKYLLSLINFLGWVSRGQNSWLIETYKINNSQNKCKVKKSSFCMKIICHKLNQENIKGNMWRCYQHVIQKYHTTHFAISSKILFLVIYYFKVFLFFVKEVVTLIKIHDHLQKTENPHIGGFFDTEVDHKGNANRDICNIHQFSRIYTSNFTTHTCSKEINNHSLVKETETLHEILQSSK